VVLARVAQRLDRPGGTGDPRFQVEHELRFRLQALLRGAGQEQDPAHVVRVAGQHLPGPGVVARVVRRVGQRQAALREVADVALELVEVDVGGEVEDDRNADLVQCGDGRGDVAAAPDRVDAGQQRRDRVGAVTLDRGLVEPAGPEVAEQALHVVLWRAHRPVEQLALLLDGQRLQPGQRAHRTGTGDGVRGEPVLVDEAVEVRAGGRAGRRLGRGAAALGAGVRGGEGEGQAEGEGNDQRLRL